MTPGTTPQAPAAPRADAAEAARAACTARRSRLGLEITVVLCAKLLLLLLLREVWFSHPQSRHLTERGVAAALFGPVNGPLPREERTDGSGH
jgi:hypothetical protein